MNSTLEFILRMKDMLTPAMRSAAGASNRFIQNIRDQLDRAAGGSRSMAASITELQRRLEAVNKIRTTTRLVSEFKAATAEARRLEEAIDRLNNKGKGGGVMESLSTQIMAALSIRSVIAFLSSSAMAAANFEKTNKSYEVLSGSVTRGRTLSNQLLDLKQNTMLGASVYANAQTLMGFGVSDREVVKDLRMLGDVAMGDADRLQRLTLVFAQTHAAGKLMGQDLLQYINAGFNPLSVMSERWKEFGLKQKVSVGQLREMMEKGQITSKAVVRAFELATSEGGRFYKMMDQLQQTTAGKLQLLKGQYAAFQITVGQSFQGVTNALLSFASATLKAFSAHKSVATQVAEQVSKIKALQLELTTVNTSEARRLAILKELSDINPNITQGINAEAIEYGKLAGNINKVVFALNQKKIASSIEDANAKDIFSYNKSLNTRTEMTANIFRMLAQIDPSLAERTDLSFGQKQFAAIKILQDRIKSGQATNITKTTTDPYGGAHSRRYTEEQNQIDALKYMIDQYNKANGVMGKVGPGIAKAQREINAATNAYNKMFNLSGTPPPAGKTGGATAGGTTGIAGTDDMFGAGKAGSISRGGQRSIVINIGKQIEHLDIHVMGKEEAGQEIARAVREELVRVLHSVNGNNNGGL